MTTGGQVLIENDRAITDERLLTLLLRLVCEESRRHSWGLPPEGELALAECLLPWVRAAVTLSSAPSGKRKKAKIRLKLEECDEDA